MEQLTAALAAPRLLRHARRALLLIGAAFAWWLVFSGGPAQADDGGPAHQAVDPVDPITHVTKAATDTLRGAPKRVTDAATATTRRAPKTVRDLVGTTTAVLEPRLTRTTTNVADAVDASVARTADSVPPALEAVPAPAVPAPHAAAISQPRKASAPTTRHHRPAATAPAVVLPDAALTFSGVPAGDRVTDSEAPGHGLPGIPAAPAVPSAPSGSTGAPGGPLAALGGLLIVPPAVRRRRLLGGRPSRRLDPAYTPGCSPD